MILVHLSVYVFFGAIWYAVCYTYLADALSIEPNTARFWMHCIQAFKNSTCTELVNIWFYADDFHVLFLLYFMYSICFMFVLRFKGIKPLSSILYATSLVGFMMGIHIVVRGGFDESGVWPVARVGTVHFIAIIASTWICSRLTSQATRTAKPLRGFDPGA